MTTAIFEKIPDNVGYLVLNEVGAILASGGDLENDERVAETVFNIISLSDKVTEGFNRVTINFPPISYVVCLSNKRIYVVKRHFVPEALVPKSVPYQVDTQVPISNSINS